MVMDGYLGKGPKGSEDAPLQITGREREVVQLLAEGKGTKEVATMLNVSVKTVETHRTNIMRKLDCHSVTELVRYAVGVRLGQGPRRDAAFDDHGHLGDLTQRDRA